MVKIKNLSNIDILNNSRKLGNKLPHDNEAEEILIGALISENNSVELIENGLSDFSSDFSFSKSRRGLIIFSTESALPSPRGILRSNASAIIYILFGMW